MLEKKELFLKIWKDPVWSKVISVVIIGIATIIYSLIIEINYFDFLVYLFNLPIKAGYTFIFLITLYLTFVIKNFLFTDKDNYPKYTQDIFWNANISWKWSKNDSTGRFYIKDKDYICLCPNEKCLRNLKLKLEDRYLNPYLILVCNCGFQSSSCLTFTNGLIPINAAGAEKSLCNELNQIILSNLRTGRVKDIRK